MAGDSEVILRDGIRIPIESLFRKADFAIADKEYDHPNVDVLSYDPVTKCSVYRPVKYIMRHRCKKRMFRVYVNGDHVDVTEDHSLMAYVNNGDFTELKPEQVLPHTQLVHSDSILSVYGTRNWHIEEITFDGYVYDIEVEETHTFFANNILVHNTDSAYVTIKWFMEANGIEETPENAVAIADEVGSELNSIMPDLVADAFLITSEKASILEAGREIVAIRGLFKDKKKRYALHVIDVEGKKPDKPLKIMGMETRRSDTPKFIQQFLEKCIEEVVVKEKTFEELVKIVEEFRQEFRQMEPHRRGSPCRVSNLTIGLNKHNAYNEYVEDGYVGLDKPKLHFSVPAAFNTNALMDINKEHRWDYIRDGDKIEVLTLLKNPYNYNAVAIKTGEIYVPEWFKKLPFDNDKHEKKLIDKKLENVFGVLGWKFEAQDTFSNEIYEEEDFFAGFSQPQQEEQ